MLSTKMKKWLGFHFSTGSETGDDYKAFQRDAKSDLRAMCKESGLTLVKFNPNHYEFSAVLQHLQTGQYIYVSIPDVRFWPDDWHKDVLIRTMAHDKDWTGGPNHRCMWDEIGEYACRHLCAA